MTLTEQIIAMASTAAGASLAEIKTALDRSDPTIGVMVSSLVKAARLTPAGTQGRWRYFADPAHAEAAAPRLAEQDAAHRAEVDARRKAREEAKNAARRALTEQRRLELERNKPPKAERKPRKKRERPFDARMFPAPVAIAKPAIRQQIVMPPGIKVQKGPSYTHDPRFQCGPSERVVGPFSLVGIGRDVTTGKAWEAA